MGNIFYCSLCLFLYKEQRFPAVSTRLFKMSLAFYRFVRRCLTGIGMLFCAYIAVALYIILPIKTFLKTVSKRQAHEAGIAVQGLKQIAAGGRDCHLQY